MPDTYVQSVVAVCPKGHKEVNLKSHFYGSGRVCARCGGTLTAVREGQVRAHPTRGSQTGTGGSDR